MWKNYVEPVYEEYEEEEEEYEDNYYHEEENYKNDGNEDEEYEEDSRALYTGADVKVKVTEIGDACTFYVHIADDQNFVQVDDALKNFVDDGKTLEDKDVKNGKVYAGLFPTDGTWHRVRIESKTQGNQYRALFVDYGNRDVLELSQLRTLDEELSRIPPTAHQMFLSALKAPGEGSEYFEPAGQAFSDLVWDRELNAHIDWAESGKYHATLTQQGTNITINQLLLESGWVRVATRPLLQLKFKQEEKKKGKQSRVRTRGEQSELYKNALIWERVGKNSRKHIWEYGDVSDEEEDARDDRGRVPSKKAKEKEAKEKEEKK